VYVFVHNQTTDLITLNGGVDVPAGHASYIGVSRTFTSKKKAPYSDCIEDLTAFSDYSKTLFGYFADLNATEYDQDICKSLCYQDKLIDNCNCCSTLTPSIRNSRYCESNTELTCESNFEFNFTESDTNAICGNVCRQKCESEKFQLSSSLSYYPSEGYISIWTTYLTSIGVNMSSTNIPGTRMYDWVMQSIVRLTVNYDQQMYTKIEEAPAMNFDQLLGMIGGAMGLFVGASILTAVELIELFVEFLIINFKPSVKNKNKIMAFA
jgi:hypothetical protein